MRITQSNIRSVVSQVLLLIFLAVLRAKADDKKQLEQRDYFHNLPTFDPLPGQTASNYEGIEGHRTTTSTTTTTVTASEKETVTAFTSAFTGLASIANDPETISTNLVPTNTPLPSTNTTNQYTNTSDPLVQYDLDCKADLHFCNKVSEAVGAAIDEFSRVINVKNSLL